MTRRADDLLRDALAHFEVMLQYGQQDTNDQLVIDAACMRLSAGIGVLARLDQAVLDDLFGDSWPLMRGMRNRIAHGYLLVDTEIILRTLEDDIPMIVEQIRRRLT